MITTNSLKCADYKLLGEKLGYKWVETDYDYGGMHWESPEGVDMCDFGPDVCEISNFITLWNLAFTELIENQKRDLVGFLEEGQIDLLEMVYNLTPVFDIDQRMPILLAVFRYLDDEKHKEEAHK